MDTFFYCLSPFLGFFSQSNPNSEDSFLVLRNTKVPQLILYMWIVNSLKRTRSYGMDGMAVQYLNGMAQP